MEQSTRHQTGSADQYHKLRSWYLARLRQESTGMNVTPIARIEFDRAFMEKVLAEAKVDEESVEPEAAAVSLTGSLLICWLLVNALCLCLTVFFTNFLWGEVLPSYFFNSWALLLFVKPTSSYLDSLGGALVSALFFGGLPISMLLLPAEKLFKLKSR